MLIIFLALIVPVFGQLVPISEYIGKHSSKCMYGLGITGNIVGEKIYTFGGCYPIPYVVDPNIDNDIFFSMNDHHNTTDLSYAYNIINDKWEFETKTPYPMKQANTEVVGSAIYFYQMRLDTKLNNMEMWKYETQTKAWSHVNNITFTWHGTLASCHHADKIYMTGTDDGHQINIIHVYNTISNTWESPIYIDKQISIRQMLCDDQSIKIIGNKMALDNKIIFRSLNDYYEQTYDLISVDYSGTTTFANLNITGNFDRVAKNKDWFYFLNISKNGSIIFKLNSDTHENKTLANIPSKVSKPLLVPFNDDVYLIGGGLSKFKHDTDNGEFKTLNHKIKQNTQFMVQEN
jgi:hypothetical protein